MRSCLRWPSFAKVDAEKNRKKGPGSFIPSDFSPSELPSSLSLFGFAEPHRYTDSVNSDRRAHQSQCSFYTTSFSPASLKCQAHVPSLRPPDSTISNESERAFGRLLKRPSLTHFCGLDRSSLTPFYILKTGNRNLCRTIAVFAHTVLRIFEVFANTILYARKGTLCNSKRSSLDLATPVQGQSFHWGNRRDWQANRLLD